MNRRATGCLSILLACETPAPAQVLTTHALAAVRTELGNSPIPGTGHQVRNEGNGAISAGPYTDSFGSTTGMSQAYTGLDGGHFLHAASSASGVGAGQGSGSGVGLNVAGWRDVVQTVDSTRPTTLRLTFGVFGTVGATQTTQIGFPSILGTVGVITTTSPTTFFDGLDLGAASTNIFPSANYYLGNQQQTFVGLSGTGFSTRGTWDSISTVSTDSAVAFDAQFHLDLSYDPTLGGYGWGVALEANSLAAGGSAVAEALDSVSLISVALPDGTPVSVTFESGLQFTPVPEPSSLLLLCGAGLGGPAAWARRRAARVSGENQSA